MLKHSIQFYFSNRFLVKKECNINEYIFDNLQDKNMTWEKMGKFLVEQLT